MSHSTDVSDFQPTSLSHLIGQRNVIRQVEVALDACQQDCKRFDHAMALRLLQSCHRVCRSLGEAKITIDHLQKACGLEQIDDLGLGTNEQQYLSILAEGPNRLNVLASRLALPGRTVSQVIEAFLIRAGLVMKDHQGIRQLTAKGREHLLGNRSKFV
jgi:Holliday junction resolvasome RuvABC ATP-dependent DNA helicase subunit